MRSIEQLISTTSKIIDNLLFQKVGWVSLPAASEVPASEQQPNRENWGVFGAQLAQAGYSYAHKQLYTGAGVDTFNLIMLHM